MENQELNTFIDNLKEKLGDENSALISDDLGILITKNNETIQKLEDKDKEINRLSSVNEKLVSANGSLLQQVSVGIEKTSEDDTPKKSFNFRDAFDEKGNFKKKM